MKKSDVSRLRGLVDLCKDHGGYEAWLLPPQWRVPTSHPIDMVLKWPWQYEIPYDELQWGLETQLDNGREVFWNENPWVVKDWPALDWIGSYFFHRSCAGVYLVQGATRDFNGSIYRPRLRAFKKMVRWAMPKTEVGFTALHTISAYWGYMLISPWLIKSTDSAWLQRIKLFSALSQFDPEKWPTSLLLRNWEEFRRIQF